MYTLLFLSLIRLLNFEYTMEIDTTKFRVQSTKECIEYIESFGLTIHDESEYEIQSHSGLVYLLPNKEVVLIPANFDLKYPGIIFQTLEIFKYYSDMNFFPIGDDEMSWFELHNFEMKQFVSGSNFYARMLCENIKISLPIKSKLEIENVFLGVQNFLNFPTKDSLGSLQVDVINAFALSVIRYLVDYEGYKMILRSGFENYNPISEVLVEKNGDIYNIFTYCHIYLESYSQNASKGFIKSIWK